MQTFVRLGRQLNRLGSLTRKTMLLFLPSEKNDIDSKKHPFGVEP